MTELSKDETPFSAEFLDILLFPPFAIAGFNSTRSRLNYYWPFALLIVPPVYYLDYFRADFYLFYESGELFYGKAAVLIVSSYIYIALCFELTACGVCVYIFFNGDPLKLLLYYGT